jgi:hypothetical protein
MADKPSPERQMSHMCDIQLAPLTTLGRQHLSDETRARLQAQEDAKDLLPSSRPGPPRIRIIKLD